MNATSIIRYRLALAAGVVGLGAAAVLSDAGVASAAEPIGGSVGDLQECTISKSQDMVIDSLVYWQDSRATDSGTVESTLGDFDTEAETAEAAGPATYLRYELKNVR